LQVLCHNCNCAKGRDRECPHLAACTAGGSILPVGIAT
jgi:hypothetical protein